MEKPGKLDKDSFYPTASKNQTRQGISWSDKPTLGDLKTVIGRY
jgi:hypothetical protein